MKYRPEIDGLRTVAVVPVILHHAGAPLLHGGFLGVDVFFVISGYLITTILLAELAEGRFSITRFYERRARRILPALTVMLLACLPFAWAWMSDAQLAAFGRSLASVALFLSNMEFWRQSGYFDTAAELKPLLHTWSLAVEEQYYLFFPVLLALLWKFGRRLTFAVIVVLALASLALAQIWSSSHPSAAFFWAPPRMWELFAGSICAFLLARRSEIRGNNLLSLLGLAMLLASMVLYDDTMPLPSVLTLVPILGTVLIVCFATPATWTGALLSLRPVVWVGLLSYSAYLWHQPLMAFARIRSLTEPPLALMLGLGVLSVGLAWLSWRFVEQPFRKRSLGALSERRGIFAGSAVVLVAMLAIGGTMHWQRGFPQRIPQAAVAALAAAQDYTPYRDECLMTPDASGIAGDPALPGPACLFPAGTTDPQVLIVGDSHASALGGAFVESLTGAGIGTGLLTIRSCAPFPGVRKGSNDCDTAGAQIRAAALESDAPVVVIALRYGTNISEAAFDNGAGGREVSRLKLAYTDPVCTEAGPECMARNGFDAIARGLQGYVAAGKKVVLVYPVPEAGWDVPETYAKQLRHGGAARLAYPVAAFDARYGALIDFLDGLDLGDTIRIRPADVFCAPAGDCVQAEGTEVYYHDDDHLSNTGARRLAPLVLQAVQSQLGAGGVRDPGTNGG